MKLARVQTSPELRNEHPLFCPVFTLDKSLQSGTGMLPKWNPRSNAGVYLGHSPDHASNVALVLNLATGLVSPQYHVVFMIIIRQLISSAVRKSLLTGKIYASIIQKTSG